MSVVPPGEDRPVSSGDVFLGFAEDARRIGAAARKLGLVVPAFRSPPRIPDVDRSLRNYPGGWVVSVTIRGRERDAIRRDMIAGVVEANGRGNDLDLRAGIHREAFG